MKKLFAAALILVALSLSGCMALMHGDHMGHHGKGDHGQSDESADDEKPRGGHSH